MTARERTRRASPFYAAMLVLIFLGPSLQGCTQGLLTSGSPASLPSRSLELDRVPVIRQQNKQCGAAALTSVLNWSGLQVSPDSIADQVYNPSREGSLQFALLGSARRHGRLAYPIQGLEQLFLELRAGRPIIVLQNLGLPWFPVWHYSVVQGYDASDRELILLSGKDEPTRQPLDTFRSTWSRSGHWGLLILRPGSLPASLDRDSYIQAVLGLERVQQWSAAAKAYEAGLTVWPESLTALIGLGNCNYALGQMKQAEQALRRSVQLHPLSGIAWNNLAQVLIEIEEPCQARRAARKAVSLGGEHLPDFQSTLSWIESSADLSCCPE